MEDGTVELVNPKYVKDLSRPAEVAWWAAHLAVSEKDLIEAAEAVGPEVGRVSAYLRQMRADADSMTRA
jgi:hypothetical protein